MRKILVFVAFVMCISLNSSATYIVAGDAHHTTLTSPHPTWYCSASSGNCMTFYENGDVKIHLKDQDILLTNPYIFNLETGDDLNYQDIPFTETTAIGVRE